jgi:hypothetical protein
MLALILVFTNTHDLRYSDARVIHTCASKTVFVCLYFTDRNPSVKHTRPQVPHSLPRGVLSRAACESARARSNCVTLVVPCLWHTFFDTQRSQPRTLVWFGARGGWFSVVGMCAPKFRGDLTTKAFTPRFLMGVCIHSPTHPLTHSPTHPLTHSPTHPLTHSPTHTIVPPPPPLVPLLLRTLQLRWPRLQTTLSRAAV